VDTIMTEQTSPSRLLRERAHESLGRGDEAAAERLFLQLLEADPADLPALQFLAMRHLSRGEVELALGRLAEAHRRHPLDAATLYQSGLARTMTGDLDGAAADLREAIALAPAMFIARFRLGMVLQQLGQADDALVALFAAINQAQLRGRWVSDETTEPGLRDAVKRAMNYVNVGRRRLFDGFISPWRERYGRDEMTRVEACLAIYLGEKPANLPDPRQQPKFLYFPGIPSQPYYPRERFAALEAIEAETAAIREELRNTLSSQRDLEAFLGANESPETAALLSSSGDQPAAWDAYFFYRHGVRYDDHHAACPRTSSMLESAPIVRIRDHAPEALFSVLRPGTHILPHRGVTNTRLVTHLPLMVPRDCALRVGGELHAWEEGRCVTFDDTFEHEAWNRSSETRVVLIFDCWNPDLTGAEREALTDLIEGIGVFNDACQLDTPA
jgi:aspartate beta-hydroxylase